MSDDLKKTLDVQLEVGGNPRRSSILPRIVLVIGSILIITAFGFYFSSKEKLSESGLRSLAIAYGSDGTPETFLKMANSESGLDLGWRIHSARMAVHEKRAIYCGAIGTGLLFLSCFMSAISNLISGQKKAASPVLSPTDQLFELKKLLDSNIISKEEYEDKRKKIWDSL